MCRRSKKITLNRICTEEEYEEIKVLVESEDAYSEDRYEYLSEIMREKYDYPVLLEAVVGIYEGELKGDSSIGTQFYLNENGDLCYVRYYEDGIGSQSGGAYMYNLTQNKEINEFGVFCG